MFIKFHQQFKAMYLTFDCHIIYQFPPIYNTKLSQNTIHILHIIKMLYNDEEELILGRFQKVGTLIKTASKEIVLLKNINDNEKCVGKIQPRIKMERTNVRNVLNQASFLQIMQGHIGIPLMHWSGVNDPEIIMIVEYLGHTVQQKLDLCGGKFTLKTTCMLGLQILKIIRNYHDKGFVHRNINPRAFQFGRGIKSNRLFFNDLIDSKRYRNKKTLTHISSKDNIKYTYTNHFASMNFLAGKEISRKDDIQSFILMLGYFVTGYKPNTKGEMKQNQKYPVYIQRMVEKCRNQMDFIDQPDYGWYQAKLRSLIFHNREEEDGVYDWMLKKNRNIDRKINTHIINVLTEKDIEKTIEVYEPYQENIDIDELSTKHYNLIGINEISASTRKQISMEDSPEKVMGNGNENGNLSVRGTVNMTKKNSEGGKKIGGCSLM